ncbi:MULTISPECIES: OmpA family protein [Microbulbifer]|uniref:OmpA family protein n=1 Tax=Microbulbifer celer TaxID=435905 RepID=A0ABW3U5Q6_9GAMM|nr:MULTISPECIES: OmpA family protein [Microbulbifer]UFN58365.1 OmpA family protein [Microbulbifer celer]
MQSIKYWGIPLIATLAVSTQVQAQEDRYVDVMPFLTRVDKDRNTERQGAGLRGTYGWQTDGNWFTEVQLFGAQLDEDKNLARFPDSIVTPDMDTISNGGVIHTGDGAYAASPYREPSGDVELSGLGMDVVYHFNGRKGYSPFLLGGIGVAHNNTKIDYDGQDNNMFINVGAGIVSGAIADNGLKVRAEVRYMRDFFATDMNDLQFGIGLSIPLSCPPAPVQVAAAPPPEPKPEIINTDGDGDGVLDRNDKCPDTLPGAEVDSTGCVVKAQTITLENIQFEFNSARLTPNAEMELDQVVRSLRSQPGSRVEVAGHTDSKGNDGYNLRLSRERAESVRKYLVRGGIDSARISARGYGETQPIATNATEEGRAMNRRVEMRFE